jgi:hypothetical protein
VELEGQRRERLERARGHGAEGIAMSRRRGPPAARECGDREPGAVSPCGAAPEVPLGAKLGAILCGERWTARDANGRERPIFSPIWTVVDSRGHGLEIYGQPSRKARAAARTRVISRSAFAAARTLAGASSASWGFADRRNRAGIRNRSAG